MMISNLRISVRLAISIALAIMVVIGLLLPAVLREVNTVTERAEFRQLVDLHRTLKGSVDSAAFDALVAVTSIVHAPGVSEALAGQDRALLQDLTMPIYQALAHDYKLAQFQFHLTSAVSFLRLHDPARYGDDLSSFRATVVRANTAQKAQSGLESGVAGLGLRGVIPVFHQGRHVGSAEVGVSFGQDFFDRFTSTYQAPTALHVRNGDSSALFASTIPTRTTLSQAQVAEAFAGKPVVARVRVNGQAWSVMAKVIPDYSGQPVAVAEILIDRAEYEESYRNTLLGILLGGGIALMVGLLLAWLVSRTITRPIELLTEEADAISRGQFDSGMHGLERKDEIGDLSRALKRMATSIKIALERIRKSAN